MRVGTSQDVCSASDLSVGISPGNVWKSKSLEVLFSSCVVFFLQTNVYMKPPYIYTIYVYIYITFTRLALRILAHGLKGSPGFPEGNRERGPSRKSLVRRCGETRAASCALMADGSKSEGGLKQAASNRKLIHFLASNFMVVGKRVTCLLIII